VTQDIGRKRKPGHRSHRSSRRSKKSDRSRLTKSDSSLIDGSTDKELTDGEESRQGVTSSSSKDRVGEDFVLRASMSEGQTSRGNVLSSDVVKEEQEVDDLTEGQ